MKRIAIMNNGTLPIPSVLGGAVETLVQLLVDTNEKEKQMQLEILSIDNVNAREKAKEYRYTHFHFVSTSSILNRMTDFLKRCYNFIALQVCHLLDIVMQARWFVSSRIVTILMLFFWKVLQLMLII